MARGFKRDIKDAGKKPTPKPTTKPRTTITVNGGVIRRETDQPRPDTSKPGTKPKEQENQLNRDRILGIVSRIGIDIGLSGEQMKGLLVGVNERLK